MNDQQMDALKAENAKLRKAGADCLECMGLLATQCRTVLFAVEGLAEGFGPLMSDEIRNSVFATLQKEITNFSEMLEMLEGKP